MRKMNWLIGTVGLSIGIMIGILGFVFLTSTASGAEFINWGIGKQTHTSVQPVGQETDSNIVQEGIEQGNLLDNSQVGEDGLDDGSNPPNQQNNEQDSTVQPNPDQLPEPNPQASGTKSGQTGSTQVSIKLAQQIISDYKQDIGTFFEAWKSPDMKTFRVKLAQAYSGELFEQHARRAEKYLTQGIGLAANDITFNKVEVEQATNSTATLTADYTYMASDYSIADAQPMGVEHLQTVHVRVNMIKLDSRWLITGESIINQ